MRKKTNEEFLKEVYEKNEYVRCGQIEILGMYSGSNEPIKCRCNIHNKIWDSVPDRLLHGSGCIQCAASIRAEPRKYTHDKFMEKLYECNEYVRNGKIEILGTYTGRNKDIECVCHTHNYYYKTTPLVLYEGCGCKKCKSEKQSIRQIKSQDEFIHDVQQINSSIVVVGQYVDATTPIDFMCENGHIWTTTPVSILNGSGCHYCSGKKILVGFNDLWSTHEDIAMLLNNAEDGYKYTSGSNQKVEFKCPLCGTIQEKNIYDIVRRGFSCKKCSDHLSFPNKFGMAFMDQLPIDNYETEYHPDWARPYFYDVFFEYGDMRYIVEWDGGFHFDERDLYGISLDERQERDKIKTALAIQNGIEVIRINCIESECNYIKTNIINSKLNKLFDLSGIDWDLCNQKAQKNLVKEVCDLYMSGIHSFAQIGRLLHIHRTTAYKYAKKGHGLGWCDYIPHNSNNTKLI